MRMTLGDAIKKRLLNGTVIKHDEKGAYIEWDSITLRNSRVEFKKGDELISFMQAHADLVNDSVSLLGLDGRMRICVD